MSATVPSTSAIEEQWIDVTDGPGGGVQTRVVRPRAASGPLPVIVFVHSGGWAFTDLHDHDRFVRELAVGCRAAVVLPERALAPTATGPSDLEAIYAVACWVAEAGPSRGLDTSRVAVVGDSVGGNMTAATTLLAQEQRGIPFVRQVLFYPVVERGVEQEPGDDLGGGAMIWFWDEHRDGEAYAAELRQAGATVAGAPAAVDVGTARTAAAGAVGAPPTAIGQAVAVLRASFGAWR
jgi:acetyl esterase/lipase